jgi:predicted Na+-dependent transporter
VVLLFSICPGVALLPFLVKMKGGRVPTALGLLLILTAIAPVTVPVWLSILNRIFPTQFVADPGVLVAKLVPTVLIPLAIGLACGTSSPPPAIESRDGSTGSSSPPSPSPWSRHRRRGQDAGPDPAAGRGSGCS